MKARVVVADLTTGNSSVCCELAVAHFKGVATLLLIQDGYTVPYDLRDMHLIRYNYSDSRTLKRSLPELVAQFRQCRRPSFNRDNPVLNALKVIEHKANPAPQQIGPVGSRRLVPLTPPPGIQALPTMPGSSLNKPSVFSVSALLPLGEEIHRPINLFDLARGYRSQK
ncbi:MAG: hypothetical protein LAQ69_34770 [Acidobacteriia bacterium]|nr:hypothetical protein [Terriglobia bacterium]